MRLLAVIALTVCLAATTAAAPDPSDRAEALIGLARVRRDAGDLPGARRYFESVLGVRRLTAAELAEYFWVVQPIDKRKAVELGRELLRSAPERDDVRDGTLAAAAALRNDRVVAEIARAGIIRNPGEVRWLRYLADSYARRGQHARALEAYRRVAVTSSVTHADRAGLANALEATGRYQEALDQWNRLPAAARLKVRAWEESRLRALAAIEPAEVSVLELDRHVDRYPDAAHIRALTVELWAKLGRHEEALSVLAPLLDGPDRDRWSARARDLSLAARGGLVGDASPIDRPARTPAPLDESWRPVRDWIDARQFARAAEEGGRIVRTVNACRDEVLGLLDRIEGPPGDALFVDAVQALDCGTGSPWIGRAIDRAVAIGRHGDALTLFDALPSAERQHLDRARLEGQLRLWTGDPIGAIARLEPVVVARGDDQPAREALVDSYRAARRSYEAWHAAQPLVDAALSAERLVSLAELAIEADEPERSAELLERVPRETEAWRQVPLVSGRASLALGRPADALATLSVVPAETLNAPATLVLIDSTLAMRGVGEARRLADRLAREGDDWQDVAERRAVLAALDGLPSKAADDRDSRAAGDGRLALREAEIALRGERPHEALAALDRVDWLAHPGLSRQAQDLRSTALAGIGDLAGAQERLQPLRAERPRFVPYRLREAELAWRQTRARAELDRVLALGEELRANHQAAIATARVLASLGRHDEALRRLEAAGHIDQLPLEARSLAARGLARRGQAREALTLLAALEPLSRANAVLRAELLAAVEGPAAAAAAFLDLARDPDASADVFLSWAAVTAAVEARLPILEEGAARVPQSEALATALAGARAAVGDHTGARVSAERAVSLDARSSEAWFRLLDATARSTDRATVIEALERFRVAAAADGSLILGLIDRVAGLVRPGDDPIVSAALAWLDDSRIPSGYALQRDTARIRLLAAAEQWDRAVAAAEAAEEAHPDTATFRTLRADVLSWAGRHAEAIEAYSAHLAVAPDDLDAARQRARIAGWAGRFADARGLYDALVEQAPTNAVVAVERDAKLAFFDGRWREAVDHYARWIALEPANGEARFEHAEALRASGDAIAADAALTSLAADTNHRLAIAARSRAARARAPSVAALAARRSANGYLGRRLLDLDERGVSIGASLGQTERTDVTLAARAIGASAGDRARQGHRIGVAGTERLRRDWVAEAGLGLVDVARDGRPVFEGRAAARWQVTDRWSVGAGLDRAAIFENIDTIDQRLAATGLSFTAAQDSPQGTLATHLGWHQLSDGNRRLRLQGTATRVASQRWRQLRLVAWGELLGYREHAASYFAPAHFVRVDGGAEYTHGFGTPRFRGDRLDTLAAGYLLGTDSDGGLYHHPSVRLSREIGQGLALDARADLVRSASYREASFSVSLRLIGKTEDR